MYTPNSSGPDLINFNISDSLDPGVKTISPTSGVPIITEAVTIDGYSQLGATQNTLAAGTNAKLLIELDGTKASTFDGITIKASNVTMRGLVINDFSDGIRTDGASLTKIEGNFIGTDASGTQDQGNRFSGVDIFGGSGNVVGGVPAAAHNLISGNDGNGVIIQRTTSNTVQGNLIGPKKDNKGALGNARAGVFILDSPGNDVGWGLRLGAPRDAQHHSLQRSRRDRG